MAKVDKWILWCAALVLLALFFRFGMRGYEYITYTLLFIAFLVFIGNKAPAGLRKAVTLITAAGLCYFCFVEALIISGINFSKSPEKSYLIVLGAAVHGDEPSLALTHRLEGAEKYLNTHPDAVTIVSGGQGEGEKISEAQCMHDWLVARGISEERIIMEDRSTSTDENLRFARDIIEKRGGDINDTAIVSSCYHLYRAGLIARKLGMESAGVSGSLGYPVYTLGMFIREAFGVTHFWIFGD